MPSSATAAARARSAAPRASPASSASSAAARVGDRGGERQPDHVGAGCGGSGRALCLLAPSCRKQAAGEQLEEVRPPTAWDPTQLLAAGGRHEQVRGPLAGGRFRGGRRPSRPPRERRRCSRPGSWPGPMLSSAVASAVSMSPATSAANERLRRLHASPWMLSSSRAPSTASSNTWADSAIRPCIQSDVPSMIAISGKSSPWRVARPIASARSA